MSDTAHLHPSELANLGLLLYRFLTGPASADWRDGEMTVKGTVEISAEEEAFLKQVTRAPAPLYPDVKYMPVAQFRDEGYLHEVNRVLLHPLGLALEVVELVDGRRILGEVWDYRDDPEGMNFGTDTLSADKAAHIEELWNERRPAREAALGYMVQEPPAELEVVRVETEPNGSG